MIMRLGQKRGYDWKYVGTMLARSDSLEQAECLKSFVKECKDWSSDLHVEAQLADINNFLTDEEIDILSMITHKRTPAQKKDIVLSMTAAHQV